MQKELIFTVTIRLRKSTKKDAAAWHFVSLPKKLGKDIKKAQPHVEKKRGRGAIKVEAHVGFVKWKTSIFPSKELATYILPIKKEIRKELKIEAGDEISIILHLI